MANGGESKKFLGIEKSTYLKIAGVSAVAFGLMWILL